jgi:hypothetical protein
VSNTHCVTVAMTSGEIIVLPPTVTKLTGTDLGAMLATDEAGKVVFVAARGEWSYVLRQPVESLATAPAECPAGPVAEPWIPSVGDRVVLTRAVGPFRAGREGRLARPHEHSAYPFRFETRPGTGVPVYGSEIEPAPAEAL